MPSWAGGWDNMFGQPYALLNEPDATMRGIARLMAPQSQRARQEIGIKLTGSAIGAAASATVGQVKAQQAGGVDPSGVLIGGLVPIVQTPVVSRATDTVDEQKLDASLQPTFAPNPYPVEKSGNSGGGILGTVNK